MKIYIPNTSSQTVGGGWTFIRNLKKALSPFGVAFVDNWQDCDVIVVVGVTITKVSELQEAVNAGKKVVFRVDNVPRKSRNRRQTPHEKMREIADLAEVVVYQSEWAKEYCEPLTGDGVVILNGVDTDIFYPPKERASDNVYLFAYHGNSELKQFWLAHYYFQVVHRSDPSAEFWFIYDFKRDLQELQEANFDFWNGEPYRHLMKIERPEDFAKVMRQCTHFICPYTVDAAPNTLLEARACGLEICGVLPEIGSSDINIPLSGVEEYMELEEVPTLEDMGEEYWGIIQLAAQNL